MSFPPIVLSQQKYEKKNLVQKPKERSGPWTDRRTDFVNIIFHLPPPLGQTITFPSQGNRSFFSTLPHNALGGRCSSIIKIRRNFASVTFVNDKTSHGPVEHD